MHEPHRLVGRLLTVCGVQLGCCSPAAFAARPQVRGAAMLPHGTGKTVRVCVFAKDDAAELAKAAGMF